MVLVCRQERKSQTHSQAKSRHHVSCTTRSQRQSWRSCACSPRLLPPTTQRNSHHRRLVEQVCAYSISLSTQTAASLSICQLVSAHTQQQPTQWGRQGWVICEDICQFWFCVLPEYHSKEGIPRQKVHRIYQELEVSFKRKWRASTWSVPLTGQKWKLTWSSADAMSSCSP